MRQLEAWLRKVGGFQHTYCDSFQTRGEFEEMFDHHPQDPQPGCNQGGGFGYDACRVRYGAEGVFPRVYDKTRPEVDVFAWLREEEDTEEEEGRDNGGGDGATAQKKRT